MTSALLSTPNHHASHTTAHEWDTELFVLRGDDRTNLIDRCREVIDLLDHTPSEALKDLAFTLNTDLAPHGTRLSIVAKSIDDLRGKLGRAIERIRDPKCDRIRESAGIYFFSEALWPDGKVAYLFPGEGAQYLNMLADLPAHFPEVAEFFSFCDRLCEEAGYPERAVARFLFVPPDAPKEQREHSERLLRQLDNAMYSVLMGCGALLQVLGRLGVPCHATAGHSMGELAALYAADAVESDPSLFARTVDVFTDLQRDEDGPRDFLLLAVGAGKHQLDPIIAEVGAHDHVYVAMDNCPHQVVVVGQAGPVERVEAILKERKMMVERLPFARPYHTPLFAPSLGPLAGMFDDVIFRAPRLPVYSCTTGQPFPSNSAAVRELTVTHWAAPVRFTELIRNMHDDGFRFFIESGPRGNLTTFVEDILRGRPSLAIATDVPRRSGVTQLNHLAGMLAAHGVPLNLNHFYERRQPRRLGSSASRASSDPVPVSPPTRSIAPTQRQAIMDRYLGVMDQFLQTQQEMMAAFLTRRPRTRGVASAPALVATPAPSPMSQPPVVAQPRPMLGEIVHHIPSREITSHRRFDVTEDRFVMHHTIGGREASKVDPDTNGFPLLPMTFTLEMMAELAETLLPGKKTIAFRRVKLMRWLPYDVEEPTTVEVKATLSEKPGPNGEIAVNLETRDLGNQSKPTNSRWTAATATLLLADNYPPAPEPEPFEMSDEHPSPIPWDVMYRGLFHGPVFQGVTEVGTSGDEGIKSSIKILPRHDLYASTDTPAFSTDPVMLDVGMHSMCAWHLEQPDQSGRILLPVELKSLELFGGPPPEGATLRIHARLEDHSSRHFSNSFDYIGDSGKLWGRMRGMRFWRFYVPYGEVNFHGPKDEYFLSREWNLPFSPRVSVGQNKTSAKDLCITRLELRPDLMHLIIRSAAACVSLAPNELNTYRNLPSSDPNIDEWLYRRIVAKDAVRVLWFEREGERMFPADLAIELDELGRGVVRHRGMENSPVIAQVAVAYLKDIAVSVATPNERIGLGVEKIGADGEFEARRRAAVAAVAQALGKNADDLSITEWEWTETDSSTSCLKTDMGEFVVKTARDDGYVIAVTNGEDE